MGLTHWTVGRIRCLGGAQLHPVLQDNGCCSLRQSDAIDRTAHVQDVAHSASVLPVNECALSRCLQVECDSWQAGM